MTYPFPPAQGPAPWAAPPAPGPYPYPGNPYAAVPGAPVNAARTSALMLALTSGLLTLTGFLLLIPFLYVIPLVFGIIGLSRNQPGQDVETPTKWGWISLAAITVAGVLLIVAMILWLGMMMQPYPRRF